MTLPVPLGVRIYSTPNSFDMWVTPNVEDFTFRMGVPGGMLDASIRFRKYSPIGQPDATIWTPTTSAVSTDAQSFKVTDANAALINTGDRFWVYDASGNIRMNGDRFSVTGKSSAAGTTTVSYAPSSSALIASGDTVIAKVPAAFYDTQLTGFNKMISMFNRIQIVDLTSAEIAWEGRIEQPARESEKDLWTLGCLGTTVFASDILRPLFYMDDQIDSWLTNRYPSFFYTESSDSAISQIKVQFTKGMFFNTSGTDFGFLRRRFEWQQAEANEMEGIGRWDAICNGNDDSNVVGKLGITLGALKWDDTIGTTPTDQNNIRAFLCNNAGTDVKLHGEVGTNISDLTKRLYLSAGYIATSGAEVTGGSLTYASWTLPRVQALRMDRFRNRLNTGASYPNAALKVAPIVEDVLGRFLNGGHDRSNADNPYWGYVDPYSAYVDASSTTLMVNGWSFYDGVTAKGILDKICNEAQPTAYWAIWESNFHNTDAGFDSKCNFEFVNWPTGWGYMLTSQDGLSEQPDGSEEATFVYYQYSWAANETPGYKHIQTWWDTSLQSEADIANITRGIFVKRDQSVDNSNPNIANEAQSILDDASRVRNSGVIKISRPVQIYDTGTGRPNGMARLLDPWMVRPGKLAKIIDLEPKADINDFSHGDAAPSRETDGTIFRMVNTEYSSADNTTTADLDKNQSWSIPNQFITGKPGQPVNKTYYR